MTPDFLLENNCIDIWICDSESLKNKDQFYFSLLSSEEKNRAERFKFEKHRLQFVAFHGFMRTVLSEYLHIDPVEIKYEKGEKGKPFLSQLSCKEMTLHFNLSHTHNIALLAVSKDKEVGIDIEHIDRNTDWKGVGQRFFTALEQNNLFSLHQNEQKLAFYKLWTRKEAYMKVLGTGLSLSPTEFTLTVPPESPTLVEHHSSKIKVDDKVEFKEVCLPEKLKQYCATVARAGSINDCRVYLFT